MRLRAFLIPFVAAVVFLTDQVSKYLVATFLELDQPWYPFAFLKPIFSLTYIRNTGAAFGILQNQNLFFSIVAIIVITIIVVYLRSTPQPDLLVATSLALQLGGACGNLADRLRYGYVTDFLYIEHYAVSNIADVCITLGVVLLGYHLIFRMQQEGSGQATPPDLPPAAVPHESTSPDEN